MEVKLIKKTKNKENIYAEKLKVAAYARVSTKFEKQTFSLESQIKYYTDYITRNNNWKLVKVFADEGISGKNLKNRDSLIEMLNEAMRGNIDLILTKSVSRFARNTYDLLNVVRTLKEKGVTIIFEEENINTSTLEGELLLSVLGAVAQAESENIGQHVKLGQAMIWQTGRDVKTVRPFGYNFGKNNNLLINKKEAQTIRLIFDLYKRGNSVTSISKYLNENNIKSQKGSIFHPGTISNILRNEIYSGTIKRGKFSDLKTLTIENHHEAIIDEQTWKEVHEKLKDNKSFGNKGRQKIQNFRCGICGNSCLVTYDHRFVRCTKYIQNRCSKSISYKNFQNIFEQLLIEIISLDPTNDKTNKKLIKLKRLLDRYYSEKNKLIDLYMNKKINEYQFNIKNNELDNNIFNINNEIAKLEENKISESRYREIREDILTNIIETTDSISDFNIELYNKIISFTILGELKNVRTKDFYTIRFYYDDKKEYFETGNEKKYLEYAKEFIPFIKFKYKKDIRCYDTITFNNRKYKKINGINVVFYIRKERY